MNLSFRLKGGVGSGHHGHQGRPGKRGGSVAGGGSNAGRLSGQLSSAGFSAGRHGSWEKKGAKGRRALIHEAQDEKGSPTLALMLFKGANQGMPVAQYESNNVDRLVEKADKFLTSGKTG